MRILPGKPYPLGATFDGAGVNFAVYSQHARAIDLCLFDAIGAETREALPERTAFVWHGYVAGMLPGQRYGFRAHGPWLPEEGLRFQPSKLLVDPYAKAIDGKLDPRAPVRSIDEAGIKDDRDDAWGVPKSVVISGAFDWHGDASPEIPWSETVVYEAHAKGTTKLHPEIAPEIRGTYTALASRPMIEHFQNLGVTTIDLMPIHECSVELGLSKRGLTNYWGYSTLGYFAPDQRFARADAVREFKEMVRGLHAAGLEVMIDVVYNHSCEGDETGPTLFLRGLDDRTYYRHKPNGKYDDVTGCGNTLNVAHPQVLKLIMDSLRYWVLDMHVDGFRFDLATALGREAGPFHMATFFDMIHQDPVLSRVKLVAEPWDLGEAGYQVGNFPVLWSEWNGRYRDTIRKFWRGDRGQLSEIGTRITGSSDLYEDDGRAPQASINFVTAHDGFTLRDLVSYEKKHNEANAEDNKDGNDQNYASNHGIEGDTSDPQILEARVRSVRNFFATLLFSQGVPMILHGDEIGRSQSGNNNAYCQDSPVTWLDWDLDDARKELLAYVRKLITLRRAHPIFQRRTFLRGQRGSGRLKDATWLRPDGEPMAPEDWSDPNGQLLGLLLSGEGMSESSEIGEPITDDTFYVVLSSADRPTDVVIPLGENEESPWDVVIDTSTFKLPVGTRVRAGETLTLAPRSFVLLRQRRD
jgi:glycogen operon protein